LIVDEYLARRFWPNGDALGKRMYFPADINNLFAKPSEDQMLTIVGIIQPIRLRGLVEPAEMSRTGTYYSALRQTPGRTLGVAVRTEQAPETAINAVRREIAQVDPELPFYGVRNMADRLETSLMDRRTPMFLATGFAAVALFLAAIGIYGVLAYQVSQRRREIGIRMALGAASGSIFSLVLREGGLIVGAGAALGLLGSLLVSRALEAQLYEVGAMDPVVVSTVAIILGMVALVACVLPARRAARTDPMIALTD
jgi:putative ABC transport system permease protein